MPSLPLGFPSSLIILFRPIGEDSKKIPHLQLSEAFTLYHIPTPSCFCPTQEIDLDRRQNYQMPIRVCLTPGPHYGKVIMSCQKQWQGCGAWGQFCDFIIHILNLYFLFSRPQASVSASISQKRAIHQVCPTGSGYVFPSLISWLSIHMHHYHRSPTF